MRTVLSSSAVPCTWVNDVWVKASSNIAYMSAGNLESELQNVSQKRRPNCWWERKIAEAFTFSIEVLSSRVTKWGESGSNNNNNVGARYLKTVHSTVSTYVALGVELDQELLPLEAELADLGPGECVDLGAGLEHEDPQVRHRQGEGHTLVVLQQAHAELQLWHSTECKVLKCILNFNVLNVSYKM